MVRDLAAIPDCQLPAGLAIGPVAEDHLRAIWEQLGYRDSLVMTGYHHSV